MLRIPRIVASVTAFAGACATLFASPYVSIKGYSYEPPAGWTANDTNPPVDSMFAATTTSAIPPSISVAILGMAADSTSAAGLKTIHASVLDSEKVLPSFTLLDDSQVQVAGAPGYSLTATFQGDPKIPLLKVHQLFVVHGKIGYVITGTALASEYDSVSAVLDKSLESFAFSVGTGEPVVSIDGYAVTPPKDWAVKLDSGTDGSYFVEQGATDFATNIGIKDQTTDKPVPASDLYAVRDKMIDGMTQGMKDVKVLDQETIKVAGSDAVVLEVSFAAPNVANRLWLRRIYLPHADKLFQITMMSQEKQRDACMAILTPLLSSFTWTSTETTGTSSATPDAK